MPRRASTPFADLLRDHRLARRLTQDALAESARMSVDSISALERGFRRAPQRATIALLVTALALDEDEARAFESAATGGDAKPAPRRRASPTPAVPALGGTTRLIGRDDDLEAVRLALGPRRLVTIVGTGGIGKTELALAAARNARSTGAFADVRLVELAATASGDAVNDAVARTFGLPAGFGTAAELSLALARRRGLLVLDNCEHLVGEAASLVREVLRSCPGLALLATSRRPLDVAGEIAIALAALDARAATTLFVERAREVDARFALDAARTPIVAEICRRLDGIPLAIEIAARRTRVLSVDEIRRRLDDRFRLLVNEAAREDRHRTLETLVAWSYDLLEPRDRAFFDRLSLFPDGFTLEAARTVALDGGDEYEALDRLETLVAISLVVRANEDDGTTRFRLSETLRFYGSERMRERATDPHVRRRLFEYVDALFAAGGAAYEREARVATLARLDVERETFAAALDASGDLGETEAGARLFARVPALRRWMRDDAIVSRAAGYIGTLSATAPRSHALLATLEIRLGNASSRIDALRSLPAFERAVSHARRGGDSAVLGRALVAYALGLMRVRRFDEARVALDESSACEASLEAQKERRHTHALLALYCGEGDVAAREFADIASAERTLGNVAFEFDALHFLAEAHVVRGEIEAAQEAADAAEPLFGSVGPHFAAAFRSSRAAYACLAGDASRGLAYAREALEIAPRDNVWPHALRHAALACAQLGLSELAARLEGRSRDRIRASAFAGHGTERIARDNLTTILDAELEAARLRALLLEGARASDDALVAQLPATLVLAERSRSARSNRHRTRLSVT